VADATLFTFRLLVAPSGYGGDPRISYVARAPIGRLIALTRPLPRLPDTADELKSIALALAVP
jgi:hypothetical protein